MTLRVFSIALAAAYVGGCSVAPYKFPESPPRRDLVALDKSRVTVTSEVRYSPTLTSVVFPAGDYLPVRKTHDGIYYESPRGLLVLPVAGTGFLVSGGIFRRTDSTAPYEFEVYGVPLAQPLHSMWGLNLNEKISCDPRCQFR